jgi:hypothetical protein
MDLESLGQGERFGRVEGFVEQADGVSVEVVHYQHHLLGVGVVAGQEMVYFAGPVLASAGVRAWTRRQPARGAMLET